MSFGRSIPDCDLGQAVVCFRVNSATNAYDAITTLANLFFVGVPEAYTRGLASEANLGKGIQESSLCVGTYMGFSCRRRPMSTKDAL